MVQQERFLLHSGDFGIFAGDIDGNIITLVARFQIDRGSRIGKAVFIERPCQRRFRAAGNNTVIQIDRAALDGDSGIAFQYSVFRSEGAVILRVINRSGLAGNCTPPDLNISTAVDFIPKAGNADVIGGFDGAVLDHTAGLLRRGCSVAQHHNRRLVGCRADKRAAGNIYDGIRVGRLAVFISNINRTADIFHSDIAEGEPTIEGGKGNVFGSCSLDRAIEDGKLRAAVHTEHRTDPACRSKSITAQIECDGLRLIKLNPLRQVKIAL